MAGDSEQSIEVGSENDLELYREYIELAEIASAYQITNEPFQTFRSLPMTMLYVPGLVDGRLG